MRKVLGLLILVFAGWQAALVVIHAELTGELEPFEDRCLECNNQQRYKEGLAIAEEFVHRAVTLYGEEHDYTAAAVHWLALFNQNTGNLERAEGLWLRALAIDENLHGKGSLGTARRLNMLGSFYRFRGDFPKARRSLMRALAIRQSALPGMGLPAAHILQSLGELSVSEGDFAGAENYYRQALAINERAEGATVDDVGRVLFELAELFRSSGRLDQATQVLTRARKLYEDPRPSLGNILGMSRALTSLAEIARERGDLAEAHSLIEEGLRLDDKYPVETQYSRAWHLGILADLYEAQGKIISAVPLAKERVALLEMKFGSQLDSNDELQLARHQLASIYMDLGDLANAERLFQANLSAIPGNKLTSVRNRHCGLLALAELEERRGNYQEAERLAREASDMIPSLFDFPPNRIAHSLRSVAQAAMARGDKATAESLADQIQDAEERYLKEVFSFTSERQRLAFLSSFATDRYSIWATLQSTRPLARAILRTKGLVLDSLLEDRLLSQSSSDPAIGSLSHDLNAARERVVGLTAPSAAPAGNTNVTASRQRRLAHAFSEVEGIQAELTRRVTGFGKARHGLQTTLAEVQTAIPERSALLETVRYAHYQGKCQWEDNYGILIIPRSGESRWVRLGPAEVIDRQVELYKHGVKSPGAENDLVSVLQRLYALVWQPVEVALPLHTTEVIFSPDGQLNFLSLACLIKPTGQLVGETIAIRYVSTARDLLDDWPGGSRTMTLAVWANPDFGTPNKPPLQIPEFLAPSRASGIGQLRSLDFRALAGAEREGRQLNEKSRRLGFSTSKLYSGESATEESLRHAAGFGVLHLATHGFVLPDAASQDESVLEKSQRTALTSPMLRSGLAFSGAQRTIEAWRRGEMVPAENDGIVTAEEIAMLELSKTWLAVVSGCGTGTGETQAGEGVLGLRRGFIQAGVRDLLLTLWSVDDDQTADFILDFYNASHRSGSPRQGLAETQRRWLSRLRLKKGAATACRLAGPFILSSRGRE